MFVDMSFLKKLFFYKRDHIVYEWPTQGNDISLMGNKLYVLLRLFLPKWVWFTKRDDETYF